MSKLNFLTAFNNKTKLLFQLSKQNLLNETIIISNREVFNYRHKRQQEWGKNIINFMIIKAEKNPRYAKICNITKTY